MLKKPIQALRAARLKLRDPSRPAFYKFPKKTVSRERLDSFWTDWRVGKRVKKFILPMFNARQVVAVSPSVLGTVRRFRSDDQARVYWHDADKVNKIVKLLKPKTFNLLPIQLLDLNGSNILERIYLAPTISDIEGEIKGGIFQNRHFKHLAARLERKNVPIEKVWKACEKAAEEADKISKIEGQKLHGASFYLFDSHKSNILVLDYNPKTKKVLLGLVDIGGSIKEGDYSS
ncbi:MAG: hypothetical protein Q7R70_04785 [Candidatus Diapherotrites archaeon]|nr:hypothetical protein [Candidatus Diapherotrites archaeon]